MGDDLKAAEDFITSAMFQLKPLLSGETASDRLPLDGLLHISDQAMTIHARGIARAAESVITAIKDEAGEAAINGRLISLYQLVMQYNEGLQEVLAETTPTQDIRFDMGALEAKRAQALSVLRPLLPLVKDTDLAQSLHFIAGLEAPASEQGVSLESLMPNVTDTLIAAARLSDKVLSVSYAVGDIVIPEEHASDIGDFMKDMGVALITNSLETPSRREARGEAASGQIGITAEQTLSGFTIRVECKGETASANDLNVDSLTDFKNLSAEMLAVPMQAGMVIEARNIALNNEARDVLVLENADIVHGTSKRAII